MTAFIFMVLFVLCCVRAACVHTRLSGVDQFGLDGTVVSQLQQHGAARCNFSGWLCSRSSPGGIVDFHFAAGQAISYAVFCLKKKHTAGQLWPPAGHVARTARGQWPGH